MVVIPDFQMQERSKKQIENEKNLTRGEFNGFMSNKTKSSIKSKIDNFIFLAQLPEASRLQKNDNLNYVK